MKTILETERLTLREMTVADLDFIAAMLSDPDVMRFYPKRYERDEAEGWIARQLARYERDGHGLWLAVDRASGEPVGQVGLVTQEVGGVMEPEVGYLIHPPFWRRGLATEAARATRDHALVTLGRPRVISLIRPENIPSRGVAAKLGMRREGRTRHAGLDHIVFAVGRSTD